MTLKEFRDLATADTSAIIRCPFDGCNARIIKLKPELAATKTTIANAPKMAKDSVFFLRIKDVWDFDNIGVSKAVLELVESQAVGDLAKLERLLICSECDQGPIGFAGFVNADDTDHKQLSYYLSCENVKYDI